MSQLTLTPRFNKLNKISFIACLLILGFQNFATGATYYSIATGNWSDANSWSLSSGGAVAATAPTSTDSVVIERSFTITLNGNYTCVGVAVGTTTAGTLTLGSAQVLTINGSLIIASGSTVNMSTGSIKISADFLNSGTFTIGTGTIRMNGSGNQTIKCASIYNLIIENTGIALGYQVKLNTTNLILTGQLTLTSGELSTNYLNLTLSNSNPLSVSAGTIDASTGILFINLLGGATSIPKFTNKNILSLSCTSGTMNFIADTVKVTSLTHGAAVNFNVLKFTGNFGYGRTGSTVGWLNSTTSTLIFGDGTNTNTLVPINAPFFNAIPRLIIDCGVGKTIVFERPTVAGTGTPVVTKYLELRSGIFNPTSLLVNFNISNNCVINVYNGFLNVTTATYNYGTGITVNYLGSNNQTIGSEIKNGSTITALTVNLSDNSKTITTKSAAALTVSGNVALSNGNLSLGAGLNIGSGLTLTNGALTLNGQSLNLTSGATLTRANGSLSASPSISVGTYTVSYTGNTNISSTPELFPIGGGNVGNVSINLSNATKTITTSSANTFNPSGNITITNGILSLSNVTRIAAGKMVSTGNAGVLNTNGNLVLTGSTSNPASIGTSSGVINGKVMVEMAIPAGKRAYRLLSHPFSEAITLDSLLDDINITGTGGAANGFDATGSNNSSAFTFSEAGFDGSNNSGWNAFTSTHTSIASKQALRVFYRGPRTQSNLLDGSNPTPLAATLDWSGAVNQGDVTVSLGYTSANGSNAGWNLVGNPYPSSINMQTMSAGTNTTSAYYVWNTMGGTRGMYTAYTFGSDNVVIPAGAAFFVKATSNDASITFHESNKTSNTPTSGLLKQGKKTEQALVFELWSDDTIWWDRLEIKQNTESTDNTENTDVEKLINPDVNLYSLSKDGSKLAIDSRLDFKSITSIYLGLNSSAYHFTLKLKQANISGVKAYLVDHFLNTKLSITENTSYNFEVTADPNSFGNTRFEVVFEELVNGTKELELNSSINVYPNPANGGKVYVSAPAKAGNLFEYKIISLSGEVVKSGTLNTLEPIAVEDLNPGAYVLQISNESFTGKVKIIKAY